MHRYASTHARSTCDGLISECTFENVQVQEYMDLYCTRVHDTWMYAYTHTRLHRPTQSNKCRHEQRRTWRYLLTLSHIATPTSAWSSHSLISLNNPSQQLFHCKKTINNFVPKVQAQHLDLQVICMSMYVSSVCMDACEYARRCMISSTFMEASIMTRRKLCIYAWICRFTYKYRWKRNHA